MAVDHTETQMTDRVPLSSEDDLSAHSSRGASTFCHELFGRLEFLAGDHWGFRVVDAVQPGSFSLKSIVPEGAPVFTDLDSLETQHAPERTRTVSRLLLTHARPDRLDLSQQALVVHHPFRSRMEYAARAAQVLRSKAVPYG